MAGNIPHKPQMDSCGLSCAQSEVYPMDDATAPPAITKQAWLISGELRTNIKQYLDIIDPGASVDARLRKLHAGGCVDSSLISTSKGYILTNI